MATPRGRATAVGWAEESTFGTAVSRTNWCRVYSCSLQERAAVEPIGTLYDEGQSDVADDHVMSKLVSGGVEMPLMYKAIGLWLTLAMGGPAATTGSDPYTHTWHRAPNFDESATVEVLRGSSGRSDVFTGVKVTRARISIQPKAVARLSVELLGYKLSARGSAGTPTFTVSPEAAAVYSRHADNITSGLTAAEFSWNSANYTFQSLEIDINNNLSDVGDVETDYYISGIDQSAQGEVIVRAQLLYKGTATDALRTAHAAGTESTFAITFTGPGDYQLTVTGRNAKIIRYEDPISSAGRMTATVEFRLKPDTSDGALTLALVNNDSDELTN